MSAWESRGAALRRRPRLLAAATAGAAFAVTAGTFGVLNGDQNEASARSAPDARESALVADRYLQNARETGDIVWYERAEKVLVDARRRDPRESSVATGLGTLRLARHDFQGGLRWGQEAHRLAPDVVRPLGVIVDGQIELGRYDDAARTLQKMVDSKPNLASYSRVSYYRELHGDLDGAAAAMRLAVEAGGQAPENVAYVQTLLGKLEFARGNTKAARLAFRAALASEPGYTPARLGRAQLDSASGRSDAALGEYRALLEESPAAEFALGIAEEKLVQGRRDEAAPYIAETRTLLAKHTAGGENTDIEVALFEADHGDTALAVRLGRRGYKRAPSVQAADGYAWALTRAGRPDEALPFAREATRLGSRDPLILYHAGIAARDAGHPAFARRWLGRALATNPEFSALDAPRARRALRAID